MQCLAEGGNDIITGSSTNANWKPSRMLIQKNVKMFGDKFFKMEGTLSEHITDLVTQVTAFESKVINMRDIIYNLTIGLIYTLLTGTTLFADS